MKLTSFKTIVARIQFRLRFDPIRDWLVLVSFFIAACAGIIVWNIWALDTVVSGGAFGKQTISAPPVFNQSSLDAIHTIFTSRAEEEAKYETGTYRFSDPSR